MRLSSTYGFISEKNVNIGKHRIESVREKLGDKRGTKVHHEGLVICSSMLGYLEYTFRTDSQEEALL